MFVKSSVLADLKGLRISYNLNMVSKGINNFLETKCFQTHMIMLRGIAASSYVCKDKPDKLKGRGVSSQQWLLRQFADPYVEKAKIQNYRCRSAFKLLEINEKHSLLSPGQYVVDCGAAPGSWTQVAVHHVNADGRDVKQRIGKVVGIDILPIFPVDGATLINADFRLPKTQEQVLSALEGRKVDVLLSDMAPNATGVKELDHENIVKLAYSALRFALTVSNVGASILVKIWDGRDATTLQRDLNKFYRTVKHVKPPASRSDSAEHFLLGKDFKGLKIT